MAANGGISASPQQQLNGLLAKDADKQRVAVHTFDPDATPEQKAAAAGKGRDQLKSVVDKGDAPGGKGESVFTELQKRTRRSPRLALLHTNDAFQYGLPPTSLHFKPEL